MNVSQSRRYTLRERIGEGGFGEVWLGELHADGLSPRPVAIKLARAHQIVPDLEARLRDEARLLNMLRHRVIVRVEDLCSLDGRPAVVMEYIDGVDLVELIHVGPVPLRPLAAIGAEVAEALGAAHAATDPSTGESLGLIHRDVKPENIRLQADGSVKLLDFGIARAHTDREARGTMAGAGTPGYLAPERHERKILPAGDVYSLGVVLAQAVSGTDPTRLPVHADLTESWVAELSAALPTAMRRLLREMTAREAGDRPTALACAARLRQVAAALGEEEDLHAWARRVVTPLARPVVLANATLQPVVERAGATQPPERFTAPAPEVKPADLAPMPLPPVPAPPPGPRRSHTALTFGVVGSGLAGTMVVASLLVGLVAWKGADAVGWLRRGPDAAPTEQADAAPPGDGEQPGDLPTEGAGSTSSGGVVTGGVPGAVQKVASAEGGEAAGVTPGGSPPTVGGVPSAAPPTGGDGVTGGSVPGQADAAPGAVGAPTGTVPLQSGTHPGSAGLSTPTGAPEGALATGECGAVRLQVGTGESAALPSRWKVVDPNSAKEVSKTAMPCLPKLVLSMDFGSKHVVTAFDPSSQTDFTCQANTCVPRN